MNTSTRSFRCRRAANCLAAGLLALAGAAQAVPATRRAAEPARLQYEQERADCMSGRTNEPRNICLREAAAAYAEARHGTLTMPGDGPEQWMANALKRCEAQRSDDDRQLCERRVRGEGKVEGSVAAGGQLQTLTIWSTDIPKTPGG